MSKVEKLLRPEIETFRFDLRLPNELDPIIWSIFRKKSTCFDWPALERHHAISWVMSDHWWFIFADQFGHDIQLVICILYIEYILNDSQMLKKNSFFKNSKFSSKYSILVLLPSIGHSKSSFEWFWIFRTFEF